MPLEVGWGQGIAKKKHNSLRKMELRIKIRKKVETKHGATKRLVL